MQTYQIIETVYREYFIDANSKDEAIEKIQSGKSKPIDQWVDDTLKLVDVYDGSDWKAEPVKA